MTDNIENPIGGIICFKSDYLLPFNENMHSERRSDGEIIEYKLLYIANIITKCIEIPPAKGFLTFQHSVLWRLSWRLGPQNF